jgi:hypothetical protein
MGCGRVGDVWGGHSGPSMGCWEACKAVVTLGGALCPLGEDIIFYRGS